MQLLFQISTESQVLGQNPALEPKHSKAQAPHFSNEEPGDFPPNHFLFSTIHTKNPGILAASFEGGEPGAIQGKTLLQTMQPVHGRRLAVGETRGRVLRSPSVPKSTNNLHISAVWLDAHHRAIW